MTSSTLTSGITVTLSHCSYAHHHRIDQLLTSLFTRCMNALSMHIFRWNFYATSKVPTCPIRHSTTLYKPRLFWEIHEIIHFYIEKRIRIGIHNIKIDKTIFSQDKKGKDFLFIYENNRTPPARRQSWVDMPFLEAQQAISGLLNPHRWRKRHQNTMENSKVQSQSTNFLCCVILVHRLLKCVVTIPKLNLGL